MRKAPVAVCAALLVFAASGCRAVYTPPTPHISGPDSGFVNVPVEFTALYSPLLTGNTSTLWYWDNDPCSTQTWELVIQHTFTDTGTHVVSAAALRQVIFFPDQPHAYRSEPSNTCTLRILNTRAR